MKKAYINQEKCVGCGACIQNCPAGAIHMLPGWKSEIDTVKCIGCGNCVEICHKKAPSLKTLETQE
ncbi:MAG: 4Fe-4S dicluster domain-containing protein [bacterium LCO1.1]|jgi:ferredoxin|uniref:Ferredoxin n=1 Tax=Candidatus Weimeria bifida TaxID=2599074 RepID=A0A6N7IW56_9FIRM|nr:4Fe-4S dicluster domain-containing protein [Candidatus Weimeria bifida]